MIGDASGKEGQFSDSDKKTAENFGIDYMDVEDFINEILKKRRTNNELKRTTRRSLLHRQSERMDTTTEEKLTDTPCQSNLDAR